MVWVWYSASEELITLPPEQLPERLTDLIRGTSPVRSYYAQGAPRCVLTLPPLDGETPEVPPLSDAELQALAEEHEREDVEGAPLRLNILKGAQKSLCDYRST